jgi:phosphoglycerate dehydrogenase-like enzyme
VQVNDLVPKNGQITPNKVFCYTVSMKNITITGDFPFSDEQRARLDSLGTVTQTTDYSSADEWLAAVQEADIILSDGDYLLENLDNLKDVFVTYPYIELGAFDSAKLQDKGVIVANTRGSNRNSIVEWTMFMILSLFRKLPNYLNITESVPFHFNQSLAGKKVLVIGKGSIGTGIGEVCEAFKMEVDYFTREDNLKDKAANADLIVNALNCNTSSKNLLDEEFFLSLKKGAYYVSFARRYTYDLAGMIKSLDTGVLTGAGIDCDPEEPYNVDNDFYQTCLAHEKILVTPHVAFATNEASANGREAVIANIEAYCNGQPQNILTKS